MAQSSVKLIRHAVSLGVNFQVIVALLTFVHVSESARILGVFPWPGYSHYAAPRVLLLELAKRGHQVTVITSSPQKPPVKNFRDIDISASYQFMKDKQQNAFDFERVDAVFSDMFLSQTVLNLTKTAFVNDQIRELLTSKEEFDLVLVEDFQTHVLKGFSYHFKAPCIMVNSMGMTRLANSQIGNPYIPSYMPDVMLSFAAPMTFFQRLYNSAMYLSYHLHNYVYIFPQHNKLLQQHFPGAPHLNDLYYNVSLLLINAHVSFQQPVPYVPNVIDIGGIHVESPKPLPNDIQEYLDNAKDGVIFFSMGSTIKTFLLPEEKRAAILKAFAKLKERVLWKWEDEDLPGKPSNVRIGKWLPQSDILAHPKIKLLITHGGLLSQIEAVHRGVPVLGIPIYGDQRMNMANAESIGMGLTLPYSELTEEVLTSKLRELLKNPRYRRNAKIRSKIMHDQHMTPLDRGVFWIEYVLRHKGAPHLRTAAVNLDWFQYVLLDVILFMLVVTASSLILIYFFLKKLLCSRASKIHQDKKKN